MESKSLRKLLHKYIDEWDDDTLNKVNDLIVAYIGKNEEIARYTPSGKEIKKDEIIKRALAASKRVKSGKFIAHEDVIKLAETW